MDKNLRKHAKLKLLKELRDEMSGMMGDDIGSMKKVTVAAKDQEGLEEGLEKAKELTEDMPELDMIAKDDMEGEEDMEDEYMEEEADETADMDKEELQSLIEELKQKLAMME